MRITEKLKNGIHRQDAKLAKEKAGACPVESWGLNSPWIAGTHDENSAMCLTIGGDTPGSVVLDPELG